ncbi:MAG: rod shape-determining protein MreD [Deltaproteobacteria bacterium RBG_16_54_18]|nr:MAG: rod shape-determining protein MreD [Deltaproteobacteria bacterium RBG_16_54_18]
MFRKLSPFVVGLLWVFATTALQVFLFPGFRSPDVVLIVVVIMSFQYPLLLGGGLAFALGIVQDVLSGGIIGLNALTKTMIFALSRWIARRFYLSTMLAKIAMIAFGVLVDLLLVTAIMLMGKMVHLSFSFFVRQLTVQILLTCLLSPLVMISMPKVSDVSGSGKKERFFNAHTKGRVRGR